MPCLFPLHEQLSQRREARWGLFPLSGLAVFEMSSVVAEKLQLSYTNTLYSSFSPNINLTRIVSSVIGNFLYMHVIISSQTWGLQQLKIDLKNMLYDSPFQTCCNKSFRSEVKKLNICPSECKFRVNVNVYILLHSKNCKVTTQSCSWVEILTG